MSKVAHEHHPDGSITTVEAKNLTLADKVKTFSCCGDVGGRLCGIPLTLCVSSVDPNINHFKEATHSRHHLNGCPYDRREISQTINRLDLYGQNTNMSQLLFSFNRTSISKDTNTDPHENNDNNAPHSAAENTVANLHTSNRRPRNLRELTTLLVTRQPNDNYCNVPVADILVAPKTCMHHYDVGIADNSVALVICRKTKPANAGITVSDSCFILAGYGSYSKKTQRPMYFVVDTSKTGRDKLFNAQSTQAIAILGCWHPVPATSHIYACDPIEPSCIFVLPDDLMEYL